MAITTSHYNTTAENLLRGSWDSLDYFVGAQLVTASYTFDATHTTRADLAGVTVSDPIVVSGKTLTTTSATATLDCSDLDFTVNGTFDAAWVILHEMIDEQSATVTDKLLFAIQIDDAVVNTSVTGIVKIVPAGLISFALKA